MTKALCLDFAQDDLVSDIPKSACFIEQGVTGLAGYGAFSGAQGLALQTNRKGTCVKKIYVAASVSNRIFVFDTCGSTAQNTINTPAGITGFVRDVAVNTRCEGFEISSSGVTGSARVIAVYSDNGVGTNSSISGANENVNPLFAVLTVSSPTRKYTGIAYYDKHIYVTDYQLGVIEKFDSNWVKIIDFTDQGLFDAAYYPYGIRVVRIKKNCRLAVTFIPDTFIGNETQYQNSVGLGYVDIFRTDGSFYRFINRGALAIPYTAFNVCFSCSNYIGISNHGNGRINFFDEKCGRYLSPAYDEFGNILEIEGLYGVAPDPKKAILYFAAAINQGTNGLFGRLTLVG